MADIEPPSFSLGIDLDFELESEPQHDPPTTHQGLDEDDNEDELQLRVSDSDVDDPAPALRRLRRGGPSSWKPISTPNQCSEQLPTSNGVPDDDEDDDIQAFSSEELAPAADLPAPQHHSLCSSSKLPLSGRGIFGQQETKVVSSKRKQASNCPSTSKGKSVLMDLTASPLRRFRLLDTDSDSDDPSESVHISRDVDGLNTSKQNGQNKLSHGSHQRSFEEKMYSSTLFFQKQDLWKDFYADKKSHATPTPAFDKFCNEYSSATKEKEHPSSSVHELCSGALGKSGTSQMMRSKDSGSADPPSHRYFFHADLRIQTLVQSRLPHFYPLSVCGEVNKLSNPSLIDYMSQFGHGNGAKQQTARQAHVGTSSKTGKKSKKTSHASEGWVIPKQPASHPKDAGRRRVRADGQSSGASGQWFTDENGKKVYVSKTGQELTGQQAYRSYKRESGKGFKRSKKKPASKKKK